MANYLITGVAGSGKSTIGRELHRRGYRVVDTDRVWGQRIQLPTAGRGFNLHSHPELAREHPAYEHGEAWVWDIAKARQALANKSPVRFFFGGADNEFSLYIMFDKVFVLCADRQSIEDRLKQRTDHSTSLPDFISKTRKEIDFRSRYLHLPNLITVQTPTGSPHLSANIIISNISESRLDRINRNARLMIGIPRLHMITHRAMKVWRRLKCSGQNPGAGSRTQ